MLNYGIVKKHLNHYKKKLGLDDYRISILFANDHYLFTDRNSFTVRKSADFQAEVTVRHQLEKDYTIVLNKKYTTNLKDTILHELLHILFWDAFNIVEIIVDLTTLCDENKIILMTQLDEKEHGIIDKLMKELI